VARHTCTTPNNTACRLSVQGPWQQSEALLWGCDCQASGTQATASLGRQAHNSTWCVHVLRKNQVKVKSCCCCRGSNQKSCMQVKPVSTGIQKATRSRASTHACMQRVKSCRVSRQHMGAHQQGTTAYVEHMQVCATRLQRTVLAAAQLLCSCRHRAAQPTAVKCGRRHNQHQATISTTAAMMLLCTCFKQPALPSLSLHALGHT
jgi:hypothetical protein